MVGMPTLAQPDAAIKESGRLHRVWLRCAAAQYDGRQGVPRALIESGVPRPAYVSKLPSVTYARARDGPHARETAVVLESHALSSDQGGTCPGAGKELTNLIGVACTSNARRFVVRHWTNVSPPV
jgi:hypothetical protein